MDLKQACDAIADRFALDAIQLFDYAVADNLGGWDIIDDEGKTRYGNPHYPVGSIWEIEGKLLYALARITNTKYALNIGHGSGCSTAHLAAALMDANTGGGVYSVDIAEPEEVLPSNVKFVQSDVMEYKFPTRPRFDFVFEDMLHTPAVITHIWGQFVKRAQPGAFIVSHDSEHYLIGDRVKQGIETITDEYLSLLIDPAACGLAIWRKP